MTYRTNNILSLFLLIFVLVSACTKDQSNRVLISTDFGEFSVKLYDETAKYRKNFIELAQVGFYDSLLFHRILPDLIIQGGDPQSRNAPKGKFLGTGNVDYEIAPDFRYVHTYGALSAARKPDEVNPQKKSSGSQFFIVVGHSVTDQELDMVEKDKGFEYTPEQRRLYKLVGGIPEFDMDYSVFGEVTDGMDVVKKISRLRRDANDRPVEDVRMFMKIEDENNEE